MSEENEKQDSDKAELSVWVAFNEDGDHAASEDSREDALDRLAGYGGTMHRVIEIKLKARLPEVTEVSVDISDEAGAIETVEAA